MLRVAKMRVDMKKPRPPSLGTGNDERGGSPAARQGLEDPVGRVW